MTKSIQNPMTAIIVAIDGPAGSGKSTVTHLLSKRLGYTHIDTGAIYRAVALKAARLGIGIEDAVRLGKLAAGTRVEYHWKSDRNHVLLDGEDVSGLIRTPEISMAASKISAHGSVRAALLGIQRKMGEAGGVVLEGRDIGTVVFPNAEAKFFLTASVDSRARRRQIEMEEKGIFLDFDEVRRQVVERDKGDTDRAVAPLRRADDAIEVDTTGMNVEQVVDYLTNFVVERAKAGAKKR